MEKLDFPNRITIELTNQCNVSCTFCPRQCVPMNIGFMDKDLFIKIADEASQHLPVKMVVFFRGESLLHPDFMELMRYAKSKGLGPLQFATNAYAMTHEVADELVESGVDFISFSLDTLDPVLYRQSRLMGDLEVSMEHVRYLSEKCRERLRRGESAPTLQVSTIEVEDYVPGQGEFVEYWKKYVDDVRVYYEHDDKGCFRNPEVQKMMMEAVPERKPCRKVFTDFLIYWNGDLALCNYDWRGGIKSVNVRDMSVKECWDSDEYEKIRQMHQSGKFGDIMCGDCGHWRIDYMDSGFLGKMYEGDLKSERKPD
ncbi:MAG: radical SAM protein [Lachnospiraceae bacterium]|nr:radical SAM protein [Lachnospiraceae bacterium]